MRLLALRTTVLFLTLLTPFIGVSQHSVFSENRIFTFKENRGQIKDQHNRQRNDVFYSGHSKGVDFFLKKDGISYQVISHHKSLTEDTLVGLSFADALRMELPQQTSFDVYRIDIEWVKPNPDFELTPECEPIRFEGYNIGASAKKVGEYEEINAIDLWDGIDVKWYENAGRLEYDFIVAPNARPDQIGWKVEGAQSLAIGEEGQLLIQTPFGTIEEEAPIAYQNNQAIKASWKIDDGIVGFDLGSYDEEQTLIIDPIVKEWGTYFGGENRERFLAMATDSENSIYAVGWTRSSTNIATSGAFQTSFGGFSGAGLWGDGVIVKFDSTGVREWATYIGGSGNDMIHDIAIDIDDHLYVVGLTSADSGIATNGTHQDTFAGGDFDGFLTKFNKQGGVIWSTYYGGSSDDRFQAITIDADHFIYVGGLSRSNAGIATTGTFKSVKGGSQSSPIIVKFDSSGVRKWGTYNYKQYDAGSVQAVECDSDYNVYFTSYGGPPGSATSGAHQDTAGGIVDGFLSKFDSTGNRIWGTFIGGSDEDGLTDLAINSNDEIFVIGLTKSSNGISTTGTHKESITPPATGSHWDKWDSFIMKFDSSGVRLWGSYFGGAKRDIAESIVLDTDDQPIIGGSTASSSGIATLDGLQSSPAANIQYYDGFLVKFSGQGSRIWGTYIGGDDTDVIYAVTVDQDGHLSASGLTYSSNNISTPGAFKDSADNEDGFVMRFENCTESPYQSFDFSIDTVYLECVNDSVLLEADSNYAGYEWNTEDTTRTIKVGATDDFRVVVLDSFGCKSIDSVSVLIDTFPPVVFANNLTTYFNDSGVVTLTPAMLDSLIIDNCEIDSIYLSKYQLECVDTGLNWIMLYATDNKGNISFDSGKVWALDTNAPELILNSNLQFYLNDSGSFTLNWTMLDSASWDNCSIVSQAFEPSEFDCADVGLNWVTITLIDPSGNTTVDSIQVTINDTHLLLVDAGSEALYLDNLGQASLGNNLWFQGNFGICALDTYFVSPTNFNCTDLDSTEVILSSIDVYGDTTEWVAFIEIYDNIGPTVLSQNLTVYLDSNGEASTTAAQVDAGSFDNCSIDSIYLSASQFDCSDLGSVSVNLFASDSSGNTSSASATVNVLDTIHPIAVAHDTTIYLDENGEVIIYAQDVDDGSTDNCSISSMFITQYVYSCADLGQNMVVLTVIDPSGNSAQDSAIVTVLDTILPSVTTQNQSVYLDSNGQASIMAESVHFFSHDNCAVDTFYLDQYEFSCADLDTTEVILTVVDGSGNATQAYAQVYVYDTIPPSLNAINTVRYFDANGLASLTPGEVDSGSSDNCEIVTWLLSDSSFTCSEEGTVIVELIGIDASGNVGADSFELILVDTFNSVSIEGMMSLEQGEQTTYTVDSLPGATYNWSVLNGMLVSSGASAEVTWSTDSIDGLVSVTQQTAQGCIDSTTKHVTLWPLGIDTQDPKQAFVIFPNPAKSAFTISKRHLTNGVSVVRVYDASGRLVLKDSFEGSNHLISISHLSTGIYHVEVSSSDETDSWNGRLVVN